MLTAWYNVEQLVPGVFATEGSDVAGVVVLASVALVDIRLTDLLVKSGVQSSTQRTDNLAGTCDRCVRIPAVGVLQRLCTCCCRKLTLNVIMSCLLTLLY